MPRIKELPKVNRLVGLPAELKVEDLVSHAHCTEVKVSFPPAPRLCPKCGSTRCVIKDGGRERTVRHVPCGGSGTLVTFRQRRYLCRDCGSTYYEPVYWIHASLSITSWLYVRIIAALNTPQSIRRIALDLGITEGIVDAVLESVTLDKPDFLPETLCIDEFSGESGTYDKATKRWQVEKFHCILADGDSGFVHDILPKMNKDFLKPYFMDYPLSERQKVKFVCCDMHGGYITLARECFPCATVCVDPFHVVRRVSDAMDAVRIRVQHKLQEAGKTEDYTFLKNCSRLLRTAERNHQKYWAGNSERNEDRLHRALSLSPDLEEAHEMLQNFLAILAVKEYSLQRLDLGDWIRKYVASIVPEIASAANTVRHYRGYFQNSLKYHKSNSVAEGRNRAIKEIKRNSYGRHSFENFRKRILMAFGPTQVQEETYTVFGEKRARGDRP